MNMIYARRTVSVTELKRSYPAVARAAADGPVAILNHNKPETYLISAADYERLMDLIEDFEDAKIVEERRNGPFVDVDLNDLRAKISQKRGEGVE